MTTNTADPLIGRLIDGRYQVRSRIARGGMATVYVATDLRLERRVAIKVMHGHLADDSQFKERFIQEARSAARLAHPNVVNVFDQGQDSDMAYLVMEYLPGITLRDLLVEHGKLTTEQTLDVMEAVLSGLAAAHKAGIVHRDLKPENVLLADDGRIKIGDFGLARAASANTATGAALLGTIAYLSPELVTRGIADTRSDIYAVGIMMYEMLAGEQPFKGEQPMQIAYQHANDSVPTPSTKNPKVPAELDELVLWATAREPNDRPRDAKVLLDQLHDTEKLLMTALPTGSVATQRTKVLPASFLASSEAETQVLGATSRNRTGPIVSDSTAALATISQNRRRRGWIWFVAILALVSLAGTLGWYFGTGPGANATIPASVIGATVDQATADLTALGLEVSETPQQGFSTSIAAGLVMETDPPTGTPVSKGGVVTLVISQGPELLTLPTLIGQTEDAALVFVKSNWVPQDSIFQFDGAAPGLVIDALDGDGASLNGVERYADQAPITLIVSAGPLPDVSGRTPSEAEAILRDVDLNVGVVDANLAEFSDTIAEGSVIRAALQPGQTVVRRGGTVDLIVSKGIEQVAVPDVVGMSWADAKPILLDADFVLDYNPSADSLRGTLVSKVTPNAGKLVDKGSTLTIRFALSF